MDQYEVEGVTVHAPAYLPLPDRPNEAAPCIALEIGCIRLHDRAGVEMMLSLSPDLVAALLPQLASALASVGALPSASSSGTH